METRHRPQRKEGRCYWEWMLCVRLPFSWFRGLNAHCISAQFVPIISEESSTHVVNFCRTPQWYIERVSWIFLFMPSQMTTNTDEPRILFPYQIHIQIRAWSYAVLPKLPHDACKSRIYTLKTTLISLLGGCQVSLLQKEWAYASIVPRGT